ncbi:hypothetical protein [Emticicia sp. BO119]|uniref:hypothetical protein n=1 Tax=Emticicia sp. BO119 TaxID=2757768 RepID=UPI0015F057ED|nr:hypothetical protein [Emticicia sp. BO119]MBA4851670.1 hypothetical protein [Emticicia sp. BO119]
MENEDFVNKLQRLKKPEISQTSHQEYIKLPLLNARKSATLGWWLVAIPLFFLVSVFVRSIFTSGQYIHIIDAFLETIAKIDHTSYAWWLNPIVFLLFPIIAGAMNLLSIIHIAYEKQTKEIIISIKLRFWNIVLVIIGFKIVAILGLYLIMENLRHLEKIK